MLHWACLNGRANVAELADAPDLGSGGRKPVGVQLPPFAPASVRPRDTSEKAWQYFIQLLRRVPPAQKVQNVFELCEVVRRLIEADVRRCHPGASDREVFLRVAARRLGIETVRRVYGWDPGSNDPVPDRP